MGYIQIMIKISNLSRLLDGIARLANRLMPVALLAVPLMTACGPLSIRNEETGKYIPITRATLELHREVEVPAGRSRIFFQGGAMAYAAGELQPHCELAVNKPLDMPLRIHADSFSVERVSSTIEDVVNAGRIRLASLGDHYLAGGGGGNGEDPQMRAYIMHLHSERQPHVRFLVCGGAFDSPALAKRPSLQEITAALGDYATLVLE